MENYQMNRSGCRPYNRTCGMMNPAPMQRRSSDQDSSAKNTSSSNCNTTKDNMYEHLKHLTPAMAYVPYQQFTSAYDLNYALSVGTIFPQLCKPFCGKRGMRR